MSLNTDGRFPVQQIDESAWLKTTSANLAADYLAGYAETVDRFLTGRPEWRTFQTMLHTEPREQLERYVNGTRRQSLVFLTLMMTGVCNADCPICFTDRQRKTEELTPQEQTTLLREAAALGAHYVYVPGEGEPTMDRGWWTLLETCRELDLPAVVFTNAMIFADDDLAQRRWGCSSVEAVERLRNYPVFLYAKYWSENRSLAAKMLGVGLDKLPYAEHQGMQMPAGVAALLDGLPSGRVGFEVVIERRNADEVADRIAPFALARGIPRIIEMLQHNGRTFGDPSYDATAEQITRCDRWLSPTSCRLAPTKAVVTVQGYVSPRIAILENQLPDDRVNVRHQSLYEAMHSADYIVDRRYDLECLCESIPLEMAGAEAKVKAPVTNISAPALSQSATLANTPQKDDTTSIPAPERVTACGSGRCSTCLSGCRTDNNDTAVEVD